MKTALIATMGVTPSVLASTVWELAVHPQEFLGEEVSVIPDKIVVFGTTASKTALTKQLFQREAGKKLTGWEQLRAALEKRNLDIHGKLQFSKGNIITFSNEAGEEIDDIRNAKDCHCVANSIVKELRDLAVREDWRILASISGGRKPESALLLSCMNILGRERDAVLHLVPLKWPTPTDGCDPPFLFPGQGSFHSKKDKTAKRPLKFRSETIQFSLINIPFIRVRNCLPDLEGNRPLPSFGELVSRSQQQLDKTTIMEQWPFVRFNFSNHSISLRVCEHPPFSVSLTPARFVILACDLLLDGTHEASDIFSKIHESHKEENEHSLIGAVRASPIGNKKELSDSVADFGKQREKIRGVLVKKGGLSESMAEAVGGTGNYRKATKTPQFYPSNLVSADDKEEFTNIVCKFLKK